MSTETSSNVSTQGTQSAQGAPGTQVPQITLVPLGYVHGGRREIRDDRWDQETARIVLDPDLLEPSATQGLAAFSHLEVIFHFHRSTRARSGAAHPRSNPHWPRVGILADRTQHRLNHLGVSRCELVAVNGLELTVRGLDAVDGTPVLDVKPYFEEYGPRGPVREPAWTRQLMSSYS
ncbi:SAM-dependent methyltransferase [Actinopolymorpha cephalotaxi]|uniref:tRNA (Thr-GGU) A37 N-methylase n=1 Tax=Actinopolymorpha cephalotaxi TaxID=504797 RepID=A0ABX2S7B5_9ACTN|nr:SAM-dependent methyltransferase [Actinopolymorpha cephalotaxi]NYH85540.1 tRNA (Thr-GGU) A37 N-methylase [Actinopolymorpha cephalotaxi]